MERSESIAGTPSATLPAPSRLTPQASGAKLPRTDVALMSLLAIAAAVRLLGIARPLLGHYSSKSILYAMIARNWVAGRALWWLPRVDCLYDGERGIHLVDYPIVAQLAALATRMFGGSLEVWGRGVSIAFSVLSVWLAYLLAKRWHGRRVGLVCGWIVALSPASIIYGQGFMLESSLVAGSLAMFYGLERWRSGEGHRWLCVAAVSFGLLVLTKIYLLAWLLPAGWLLVQNNDTPLATRLRRLLLPLGVLFLVAWPGMAWYAHGWWLSRPASPEASHVFFSLRDSTRVHTLPHPLLTSSDLYRRLLDRLDGSLLTPLGFGLLVLGLGDRRAWRHLPWLATCGLLVVLLPKKFYELYYYDLLALAPLALVASVGWQRLESGLQFTLGGRAGLMVVAALLVARYTIVPAFVTPPEDQSVLAAATAARSLTAVDEPITTVHGTNFDLLYYSDRPGWALAIDDRRFAEQLRQTAKEGSRLVVVAHLPLVALHPRARAALETLEVVQQGDDFRIYRLAR